MSIRLAGFTGLCLLAVAELSACGSSGGEAAAAAGSLAGGIPAVPGAPTATCAAPLPAAAFSTGMSVTVALPSDYDATATPTPTPTTVINFTLMLPKRCAGDRSIRRSITSIRSTIWSWPCRITVTP
jgi:hypothetical protein